VANRTVKTSLVAEVSGYLSGFEAAAQKTRELGSETEKLGQKRDAIDGLGRASLAFGAVAATAVGIAVAKYAEFDQAMSSVQAATHASAGELNQLRDAAIDAGARTVFSATEAANAIEELSKAGVGTKDILGGGLSGALDLASAGELKVADAAQIAATAMTQFNLKGNEVPHVADLLAAGAGKAQGSVQDLSQALNQGGLVASQAGFSINETTGTLAAFASAGLLGSDAGTSLKTAIIALQNPSTRAAATMKQYGIDVYDSSGKMLSFGGIAAQLQDKLGGLSDEQRNAALATIFGNDAVRAANVLYSEGAAGIADWTGKVNDNGYAAETARLKLDNLKGDIEQLGGAFDTALIQTGSSANASLRGLVQTATWAVGEIGGLPEPVLGAGLAVTALAGGLALAGGAALVAVPKFAAMKAGLSTLGISAKAATIATAGLGAAVGVVTLVIGTWVSQQATAKAQTQELADTLDQSTGAMTKYTRAAVVRQLADADMFEKAKKVGVGQKELTDAVLKGGDAFDKVHDKVAGNAFLDAGQGILSTGHALRQLRQNVEDSGQAWEDSKKANADSGDTAQSAAAQYQQEAATVGDLASELSDLIDQFDKVNDVNQDAISANASYQEALAGLSDQVKQQRENTEGYTTSLDQNTAIGAGNASMLADLAGKAQEAAAKQYAVDQSTMGAKEAADKYAGTLAAQRQKFIESATAAGFNAGEVQKLADKVFALPSAKQIKVLAETNTAGLALDEIKRRQSQIERNINISINVHKIDPENLYTTGGLKVAKAGGGPVFGPGTSTSDSIDAKLSNGEFVVRAAAAAKYGMGFLHAVNQGLYQPAQYAAGGPVERPTYVPTPTQLVYAGANTGYSDRGSGEHVTFQFLSSGDQRRDQDTAMFAYRTRMRGGRK